MTLAGALFLASALSGPASGPPAPDCALVPGWAQKGPSRTYGPETLFDYMDGNAEGYLAYGFASMRGLTCVNRAGDQLVIDVSELRDADLAWGIFTANRDVRSPNEALGAAGQVLPRRATFAKGRYYVEIAASPAGDHTEALRAFATALEARTPGRATPPEAVGWFPEEGLEAGSLRLVPQGVPGLRRLQPAFLARYPEGRALVAVEESAEAATRALQTIRQCLSDAVDVEGLGDAAFTATDDRLGGVVIFRKGPRIGGVVNLAPGIDGTPRARRLADGLPSTTPGTPRE
jgi:hypothetical protein